MCGYMITRSDGCYPQSGQMSGAVWLGVSGCRSLKTAPVWRIAFQLDFENKTGAVRENPPRT